MLKIVFLVLFLYLEEHFGLCEDNLPGVDTLLGNVQGFWKVSLNGRKYAAFEGIPYAKPPIDDLRFEEPEPVIPWIGVWKADNPQTCIQTEMIDFTKIMGEEDCLYLNIYVPAEFLTTKQELDVVVAIHGGAFIEGSRHNMTASRILMDRDIVLVTLNYRLGILGFLSTEDDIISGNNGLKDQMLALKWVKDNISSFQGNPHSVTLIGLSSGGASVHFHYLSPLSRGLFHKGMAQSGTALAPWAISRNAGQRAKKLATLMGCSTSKDMKRCLKQRPVRNLLMQMKHFYQIEQLPVPMPLVPFAPIVEKESPKAFLDKEPYLLLKEGNITDVPFITPFVSEDGLLPSAFFWEDLESVTKNWQNISRYVLNYNDTLHLPTQDDIAGDIKKYYLGERAEFNKHSFKNFTKMCTDRIFACSAEMAAKMQAKVTKSPVYFYVFDYQEAEHKLIHYYYSKSEDIDGVSHADDGIYFYGLFSGVSFNERDTRLINACQNILYSFASTGVPSFNGTDIWQPTGHTNLTFLNISGPDNMQLQTVENWASNSFWEKLGLMENEYFMHNKNEL